MASLNNPGQVSKTDSRILSYNVGSLNTVDEKQQVFYGRVIDIVLCKEDLDENVWKTLGGNLALYGVFYQNLFRGENNTDKTVERFAYCKALGIKQLPLKNEIVTLVSSFSADRSDLLGERVLVEKIYWTDIIPVWGASHLNAYPDTKIDGNGPADTGKNFKEQSKIYPLQLLPGDTVMEGRYGNSIRFGGTKLDQKSYSPLVDDSNNGKPYIIIRNGQAAVDGLDENHKFQYDNVTATVNECIDKDPASIYLTSEHKIPLTQANSKRSAWKDSDSPAEAQDYKDAQILLNANRLFLNARKNDIELSAKERIGINADKIGVDGKDYIGIDAKKIYLGTEALSETEPILKGQTTIEWLGDLCNQIMTLLEAMTSAAQTGDQKAFVSTVAGTAEGIKSGIKGLKSILKNLESKKSFTY